MKYKLLSLPKSTVKLPFIELSVTSISSAEEGTASTINVTTKNGGNENLGYTAILLNSDVGSISGNAGVPGTTSPIININSYATNQALAVTGLNSFIFTQQTIYQQIKQPIQELSLLVMKQVVEQS